MAIWNPSLDNAIYRVPLCIRAERYIMYTFAISPKIYEQVLISSVPPHIIGRLLNSVQTCFLFWFQEIIIKSVASGNIFPWGSRMYIVYCVSLIRMILRCFRKALFKVYFNVLLCTPGSDKKDWNVILDAALRWWSEPLKY